MGTNIVFIAKRKCQIRYQHFSCQYKFNIRSVTPFPHLCHVFFSALKMFPFFRMNFP